MRMVFKKGYVTLISTIIVGAVGVAVAISLLLLGLGSSRTSLVLIQSAQAKALVNACVENAMLQVSLSSTYSGDGSLMIDGHTCSYVVTKNGDATAVTASGAVGTIFRKVNVMLSSSEIYWQEVP